MTEEITAEEYIAIGKKKFLAEDISGAMNDYSKALEVDPNSSEAWHLRGMMKWKSGDLEGSIYDCEKGLEIEPNCTYLVATFLGELYSGEAQKYFDEENYSKALTSLDKAFKFDPNNLEIFFLRGLIKASSGDVSGAIIDYEKSIEFNPVLTSASINLGIIKFQQSEYREAIEIYTKALEYSNEAELYKLRGCARICLEDKNLDDQKLMEEDLQKAIDLGDEEAKELLEGLHEEPKENPIQGEDFLNKLLDNLSARITSLDGQISPATSSTLWRIRDVFNYEDEEEDEEGDFLYRATSNYLDNSTIEGSKEWLKSMLEECFSTALDFGISDGREESDVVPCFYKEKESFLSDVDHAKVVEIVKECWEVSRAKED